MSLTTESTTSQPTTMDTTEDVAIITSTIDEESEGEGLILHRFGIGFELAEYIIFGLLILVIILCCCFMCYCIYVCRTNKKRKEVYFANNVEDNANYINETDDIHIASIH